MKLLDYNKFETAARLLEQHSPDQIDQSLLEMNSISIEDVDRINEGFLKDLFGGIFKGLKQSILKKVPGGVLKKADEILNNYEKEKAELSKKTFKEKEKIFKAELDKDNKLSGQIIKRAEAAIEAIERSAKSKLDRINRELHDLMDDKSEVVSDYIELRVAQIKEKIAGDELKAMEKFASEGQIEKAAKEVEDLKIKRNEIQNGLMKIVKGGDDKAPEDKQDDHKTAA